MNNRTMGSLPWKVSPLGFGCMRLPTTGIIPRVDERKAVEIIRYGIDRGINYVDTAWMYHMGQSEKMLGRALEGGYRDKVKLVTKLPMIFVRKTEDFSRYLDEQLQRLRTDYLDIYLFHMLNQSNFDKMKRFDLLAKMEKARNQGKLRHIGFSFHDTLPVFKEIIDYYPWEMTQIQYNYMDTGVQATTEGLEYAHKKGIAVVIMEPLKGGQLANPPAEARAIIDAAPVKRAPVDWALQFLWNRPEVATVLSGMGSMKMVEENCNSAEHSGIGSLSEAENGVINTLAETYRKKIIVPCTSCHYCMPCPSGVNIPQNFALLNNRSFLRVGKFSGKIVQWMVTRTYRRLAKNGRQLRDNKENGRASLCTRCNACIPKCPQKIAIPQELEKVVAVFEKGKKLESVVE